MTQHSAGVCGGSVTAKKIKLDETADYHYLIKPFSCHPEAIGGGISPCGRGSEVATKFPLCPPPGLLITCGFLVEPALYDPRNTKAYLVAYFLYGPPQTTRIRGRGLIRPPVGGAPLAHWYRAGGRT